MEQVAQVIVTDADMSGRCTLRPAPTHEASQPYRWIDDIHADDFSIDSMTNQRI